MRYRIKKRLPSIIIFMIFFSSLLNSSYSLGKSTSTNIENFPYKKEITIPIDTSLIKSKLQPIDMRIKFDNPCWARNETIHSVRIGYDYGSGITELESQIYDLEYKDEKHITACSIVFIIPPDVNGKEKYYIYYDDSETPKPEYIDHLNYEDTHYYYEPISGQKIDFDYYKIIEEEYIVYGILQKGEIIGNGVSNSIARLKSNQTEFETTTIDQLATFYMSHSVDGPEEWKGSAWATKVNKKVLVNGNLMLRFRIEGISPEGTIKTDNIYTYYYCPKSIKRIYINVDHEILKETKVTGDKQRDPTYASLATFRARSATIEKMNIGNILPSIHFFGEDERIKEYSIPSNPSTEKAEWILSAIDDADMGSKSWICMDDLSTGKAHGLIFELNKGYIEGENDGIQIKASTKQHVKLPGLEGDTGDVFATRNSYEQGKHNINLPLGMKVVFNIEFITFQTEGYEAIDHESEIFQKLIKNVPILRMNVSEDIDEKEKYSLTTRVFSAKSFPLGSILSAALGKNFSYITAELYKDNSLISSGAIGRISIANIDLDFENTSLIQKIKLVIGIFDWRNFSIFKNIRFPDLQQGKYLVKIYRENPFLVKERQFIGYDIVNLEDDITINIQCRPEVSAEFNIIDQDNHGIENVRFSILYEDTIISSELSNENGYAILNIPCYLRRSYVLNVIYNGFLVEKNEMRFSIKNRLISVKKDFSTPLYNLNLKVRDTLKLAPAIEINPTLTSKNMFEPVSLIAEKQKEGEYIFTNLYPSDYNLKISYKSFIDETPVNIDEDKTLEIKFSAEFSIDFNVMNSYGMKLPDGEIILIRSGKKTTESIYDGIATILLPPGEYYMTTISNENDIGKQKIDLKGNKEISIVTSEKSLIHDTFSSFGIILLALSFLYIIWKKNIINGLKIFAISIILIALFSPWWSLSGEKGVISTTTKTFLYPSKLVTLTISGSVIGGEISVVTEEFTMVLDLLVFLILISLIKIVLSLIIMNRFRKISNILSFLSIFIIIFIILLFFYAMSQVTSVGVGSFSGNGDLDVYIPGELDSTILNCNWGPDIGFYLAIFTFILLVAYPILNIIQKIKLKFL